MVCCQEHDKQLYRSVHMRESFNEANNIEQFYNKCRIEDTLVIEHSHTLIDPIKKPLRCYHVNRM